MSTILSIIKKLLKRKVPLTVGIFLGLVLYAGFIRAPLAFPSGQLITIEEGATIEEGMEVLYEKKVILSPQLAGVLTRFFSSSGVRAETYSFERPLSVFEVIYRLAKGETGAPQIRITIPEGATTREMAEIFSTSIPNFNSEKFRDLSRDKEGYLFPETYIVSVGITEEGIINLMENTFNENIALLQEDIDASGRTLEEIVIMASLLEREARLYETRQIVAGILWERIRINMPLQVDAVFGYIYDTDTFSPTFNQLTATDSPYNTYKYKGLPPGPIANPGLEALQAALDPIETPYLFYLTGFDGTMHYARTFEEHVANRRFLR